MEKDQYATKTTINAKKKPLIEQMNVLRFQLNEYMAVRDAKIPDHEKLPKDCVYYKHFLQVELNKKLETCARDQIKDDRDLLRDIGEGFSPVKRAKEAAEGSIDPEEERGNRLVKKRRISKVPSV